MAKLLVDDVVCSAGRTEEYEWSLYKADGKTPEGIAADDVVRFKLATTVGGDPFLDLTNNGANGNGSRVFVDNVGQSGVTPASGRVRIGQLDSKGRTGKAFFELNLVDNSEVEPADAIKPICRGFLVFWGSQGGNVGLLP